MLVEEAGPFDLFERLRNLARGPVAPLFGCIYCMSVWTAALCYTLWLTPLKPAVIILAASGLALMAASYTGMMRDY